MKRIWIRALAWIYVAGFLLRLIVIAVVMWPKLGLSDWWVYMAFQALYGLFWPLLLILGLLGVGR